MSIGSAFQTLGKTVSISAGVAAQATLIRYSDLGISAPANPQAIRLINNGTVDIWVWIDKAAQAGAAFPGAGTTTAGTPGYGFRLKPGIIEVFGFNQVALNPNNEQPPNPGFFVNTITTLAAQPMDVTLGEGI